MTTESSPMIFSHTVIGSGRCFVVLVESGSKFEQLAESLPAQLQDIGQIYLLKIQRIGPDWRYSLNALLEFIDQQAIRNVSFIAFEDASVLVQAISLRRARLIRTLVFIDGATRAHPSAWVNFVESIEAYLPLGLPFRSDFPGFDGKPFLQRVRCPVLIAISPYANEYRKEQSSLFVEGMPTSFLIEFKADKLLQDLSQAIKDFQAVPAKMPQKNIR